MFSGAEIRTPLENDIAENKVAEAFLERSGDIIDAGAQSVMISIGHRAGLFDVLLPLIKGSDEQMQTGIEVLDAGCGKGHALIAMAERYPQSRFTG